jgi:hypothetical protein
MHATLMHAARARARAPQIGCMGYNARPGPIALTIEAFRDGLKQQGRA